MPLLRCGGWLSSAGLIARWLEVAVKDLGIGVEPVRPDDRARVLVDAYLAEVGGVAQWLGQGALGMLKLWGEVDLADDAVVKGDTQTVAGERLNIGYSENHEQDARAAALQD